MVPWVRQYISAASFEAANSDSGLSGARSETGSVSGVPYTAAEEAKTSRDTPSATAASSTFSVPCTFTACSSAGLSRPRAAPGKAARWNTASTFRVAFLTRSRSRMSPMTTSRRPSRATSRAGSAGERNRWAARCRFRSGPVERLSRTRTAAPLSSKRSTRWDPRNPAPPVTRIVLMAISEADDGGPGSPEGLHRITSVDDEGRTLGDACVVEARVAGENEHAVGRGQSVRGGLDRGQLVPLEGDLRSERIGIAEVRALLHEVLDDLESGRLADVVDVGLVGDAQHEDGRATHRSPAIIERTRHEVDDVLGHGAVDLVGKGDELRLIARETNLPGQIERIDGDAVPADPGAGIEGHEPEGLGRGRIDDLPGVDADFPTRESKLVGEGDVDAAEGVLEKLGGLGDAGARGLEHAGRDVAIETGHEFGAAWGDAAHYLGDVGGGELAIARIDPLGGEGQEGIDAHHEAGTLQAGLDDLLRGAWKGRALQHEELALVKMGDQTLQRGHDEGNVRLLALPERRGDADDERVGLPRLVEGGGGSEAPGADQRSQGVRRDVDQIGLAPVQASYPLQVHIDTSHGEAGSRELHGEGESDIAEPDDVNTGTPLFDLALEAVFPRGHVRSPFRQSRHQAL